MKNRQVFADAVAGALNLILFDEEGFALAEGFDSKNGKYLGLTIPGAAGVFGAISDQTLIVKPDVASNQVKEAASTEAKSNQETTIVGETESPETQPIPETQNRPAEKKRYFGVFQVDAERYGRDLNRLSQEVLQHISSLDNVDLEISIEIQAKSGQGFPQEKMRVILENAKALKFKQSSFEDE
jgi:hypothetical protein